MGESVRAVMRDFSETMQNGDSFVLNDPYNGGSHLPDVTVVTPVFDQGFPPSSLPPADIMPTSVEFHRDQCRPNRPPSIRKGS